MNAFVGLAGLGFWGKNLFRNLMEIGALHTACDSRPEVVSEYQKKFPALCATSPAGTGSDAYPASNYTTSFEEMLQSPGVRAVAIATPAATHYEMVKRALLEGKDVFVEKPLALTYREGEQLVALAKSEGRILMVGHILQYHPAVLKLKELISSGALGKIQYIYSNRLNIGRLRTEENILWSFAPHDISVMLMLFEEEPIKVSAFGGDYLNSSVYDTTLTTLEFRNGVKGHIFVSWLHPYKEQKLIVVGSKGMVVFDDVSKEKLFLYPHKIEWRDGKVPVAMKAEYQVIPFGAGEPLRRELEHFIECVDSGKEPKTNGEEGLRVLRVLEEADKATGNGKRPSALSSPGAEAAHFGPCISPSVVLHESAHVDEDVSIGEDVKVWHFSHILKGSAVGRKCIIGQNVVIGPDVTVGDGCKIQNNVSIYKGVTLEDGVFCGPSCVFTNVYNPRAFIERKKEFRSTLVRKGATIGANATIVCGVTVGRYAVVGAGAVVKRNVPDYAVVAGVPAKRIGWACRCGTTLRFQNDSASCAYCGNEYQVGDGDSLIAIKEEG